MSASQNSFMKSLFFRADPRGPDFPLSAVADETAETVRMI